MLGDFYSWDSSVLRIELRVSYQVGMHSDVELHPSPKVPYWEQGAGCWGRGRDEAVKSSVQHHVELTGVSEMPG